MPPQNVQQTKPATSALQPHHLPENLRSVVAGSQEIPAGMDFLLNYKQMMQIFNCSRTTIWRMVQDGDFPQPVKFPAGRDLKWRFSQVVEYFDTLGQ